MDLQLGQELGIFYASKRSPVTYVTILTAGQVVIAKGGSFLRLGFLFVCVGDLYLSLYIFFLVHEQNFLLFFPLFLYFYTQKGKTI